MAVHGFQDGIASALKGQMQVMAQLIVLHDALDMFNVHHSRLQGTEANPEIPLHGIQTPNHRFQSIQTFFSRLSLEIELRFRAV